MKDELGSLNYLPEIDERYSLRLGNTDSSSLETPTDGCKYTQNLTQNVLLISCHEGGVMSRAIWHGRAVNALPAVWVYSIITNNTKEQPMKNTSSKTYYTLAVRAEDQWWPEFGDYDLKTVDEEMDCLSDDYKRKDLKIIATLDDQQSIDSKIAELNA